MSGVTGISTKFGSRASGRYARNYEEASTRLFTGVEYDVIRERCARLRKNIGFMHTWPP